MIKASKKRRYSKPILIKAQLDHQINLIMMTWQPGDGKPPGPPGQDKKNAGLHTAQDSPTEQNNFESNPFN